MLPVDGVLWLCKLPNTISTNWLTDDKVYWSLAFGSSVVQGSYLVCLVGNPTFDQTDSLSQCLDSTSHMQDYQQGKEGNCSRVLKAPRSQCGNWFVIITWALLLDLKALKKRWGNAIFQHVNTVCAERETNRGSSASKYVLWLRTSPGLTPFLHPVSSAGYVRLCCGRLIQMGSSLSF